MATSKDVRLEPRDRIAWLFEQHANLYQRLISSDDEVDLDDVYKLCSLVPRYMSCLAVAMHYVSDRTALEFLEPKIEQLLRGEK